MSVMQLNIVSLDKNIFSGEVESVMLTSTAGDLTVLPHHISLITPLKAGEVLYRTDGGQENYLVIGDGFLTVQNNTATVLVSSAHRVEELEEEKILEAQRKAEEMLHNKEALDLEAMADATAMIERSIAQMKFVQKRGRKHL